jgi:hypothetical protein
MPIVSSVLTTESAQRDGRHWIEERHTDQVGVVYPIRYLADAGLDTNAVMTARAVQIGNDLATAEANADLERIKANGSLATVTTVYAALSDVRAALRSAYLTATRTDAIMIGDFLSTLTDAQLQTLFGLTAGQVTTLRSSKLTPAANAATTIRAATGA